MPAESKGIIKFSHKDKPAIDDYWTYCERNQIPFIQIISKGSDYDSISYDLLPCIPFDKLNGDVSENIVKIYEAYADFFKIPDTKFDYSGGSIALGIVVHKKHSEFIADQLFDYLLAYVKKNRISMAKEK